MECVHVARCSVMSCAGHMERPDVFCRFKQFAELQGAPNVYQSPKFVSSRRKQTCWHHMESQDRVVLYAFWRCYRMYIVLLEDCTVLSLSTLLWLTWLWALTRFMNTAFQTLLGLRCCFAYLRKSLFMMYNCVCRLGSSDSGLLPPLLKWYWVLELKDSQLIQINSTKCRIPPWYFENSRVPRITVLSQLS